MGKTNRIIEFYRTKTGKFLAWVGLIIYVPAAIGYLSFLWFGIKVAFESVSMQYLVFSIQAFLLGVLWYSSFTFIRSLDYSHFKRGIIFGFILILSVFILQNVIVAQFAKNPERFGSIMDNYLKP